MMEKPGKGKQQNRDLSELLRFVQPVEFRNVCSRAIMYVKFISCPVDIKLNLYTYCIGFFFTTSATQSRLVAATECRWL